jgi:hypothetical protein
MLFDLRPVRHRCTPIPESIERVPGYPKKLVIFRIQASSYWWIRYYASGRIYKRSSGTESRRDAFTIAKRFYDEINFKVHQGLSETSGKITFDLACESFMQSEQAKHARNQLSKVTHETRTYRFRGAILPYFKSRDIARIDFTALDEFLNQLSSQEPKLSISTIAAYMGLVRSVLVHAARKNWIHHVPEFPKVGVEDKPRGWFRIAEYKTLYKEAKKLVGKTAERIRTTNAQGNANYHHVVKGGPRGGVVSKSVKITHDLGEMIVFMVNSYIRPTDLKNMQHKHVDVIKGEYKYLRLNLPPSKGHKYPITTMPWAVRVYERIAQRNSLLGLAGPEDYVFLPQQGPAKRDNALKVLQRQFDALLDLTGFKQSPSGEIRTIYSLRHSAIMFRLLYGAGIDTLKLARNARTSPEMIDRFYAAPLMGEMAVAELQSKRRPRPWER